MWGGVGWGGCGVGVECSMEWVWSGCGVECSMEWVWSGCGVECTQKAVTWTGSSSKTPRTFASSVGHEHTC